MLRRIAVLFAAAAILSCGPLAAQAPDQGERGAVGRSETPGPRTAPVDRAPPDTRPAPSVQPELVEKAAKDSIRSLDLQTRLVTDDSQPIRLAPIRIPQEALWLALILVVSLLLYSFREELMNLLRPAETGWEPPLPGAGEVTMGSETDALAAADRLSREGNFVEAMHVLLLHSLAEIRRQLGEQFADSLTSREILRVVRLTAAARTALREIVAVVERTYFGAYPAEARDYASCRQNFETLQQALRAGAPA
jgi:Domain of unknown function (DUF4129)